MHAAKDWLTRLRCGWAAGALVLVALAVAPERADAWSWCPDGTFKPGYFGGEGNDSWTGTFLDEISDGRGGNDSLFGGGGDDLLCGGEGKDIVGGQDGPDDLHGGEEADLLTGGAESDRIQGETGGDQILGEAGDDELYGGDRGLLDSDQDFINGGLGNDKIWAWNGDQVNAYVGNDHVYLIHRYRRAGSPPNRINCGLGTDTVYGYDPGSGDTVVSCEHQLPLPER